MSLILQVENAEKDLHHALDEFEKFKKAISDTEKIHSQYADLQKKYTFDMGTKDKKIEELTRQLMVKDDDIRKVQHLLEEAQGHENELNLQITEVAAQTKIKDIKIEELSLEISKLTMENKKLKSERGSLGSESDNLKIKLRAVEEDLKQLSSLQLSVQELTKDNELLNGKLLSLKTENQKLTNKMQDTLAGATRIQQESDKLRRLHHDSLDEIKKLNNNLQNLTSQHESLTLEHERSMAELQRVLIELQKAKERMTKFQVDNEKMRLQYIPYMSEIENLKLNFAKISQQNETLTEEIKEIEIERDSLRNELEVYKNKMGKSSSEIEMAKSGHNKMMLEIQGLKATLHSKEITIGDLETKLEKLKNSEDEIHHLKSEISDLEIRLNKEMEEKQKLHHELQHFKKSHEKTSSSVASRVHELEHTIKELESKLSQWDTEKKALELELTEKIKFTFEIKIHEKEDEIIKLNDKIKHLTQEKNQYVLKSTELEHKLKVIQQFEEKIRILEQEKNQHAQLVISINIDRDELRKKIAECERRLRSEEESSSKSKLSLTNISVERDSINKNYVELQNKYNSLTIEIQNLGPINAQLVKDKEHLRAKIATLENKLNLIRDFEERYDKLAHINKELIEENKRLESKHTEINLLYHETKDENGNMKNIIKLLENEKNSLLTSGKGLNSEKVELLKKITELEAENRKLLLQFEEFVKDKDIFLKEKNELLILMKKLSGEKEVLDSECKNLRGSTFKLGEYQHSVNKLEHDCEELKADNMKLSDAYLKLRNKFKDLEALGYQKHGFESMIETLKAEKVNIQNSYNELLSKFDQLKIEHTNMSLSASDANNYKNKYFEIEKELSSFKKTYLDHKIIHDKIIAERMVMLEELQKLQIIVQDRTVDCENKAVLISNLQTHLFFALFELDRLTSNQDKHESIEFKPSFLSALQDGNKHENITTYRSFVAPETHAHDHANVHTIEILHEHNELVKPAEINTEKISSSVEIYNDHKDQHHSQHENNTFLTKKEEKPISFDFSYQPNDFMHNDKIIETKHEKTHAPAFEHEHISNIGSETHQQKDYDNDYLGKGLSKSYVPAYEFDFLKNTHTESKESEPRHTVATFSYDYKSNSVGHETFKNKAWEALDTDHNKEHDYKIESKPFEDVTKSFHFDFKPSHEEQKMNNAHSHHETMENYGNFGTLTSIHPHIDHADKKDQYDAILNFGSSDYMFKSFTEGDLKNMHTLEEKKANDNMLGLHFSLNTQYGILSEYKIGTESNLDEQF